MRFQATKIPPNSPNRPPSPTRARAVRSRAFRSHAIRFAIRSTKRCTWPGLCDRLRSGRSRIDPNGGPQGQGRIVLGRNPPATMSLSPAFNARAPSPNRRAFPVPPGNSGRGRRGGNVRSGTMEGSPVGSDRRAERARSRTLHSARRRSTLALNRVDRKPSRPSRTSSGPSWAKTAISRWRAVARSRSLGEPGVTRRDFGPHHTDIVSAGPGRHCRVLRRRHAQHLDRGMRSAGLLPRGFLARRPPPNRVANACSIDSALRSVSRPGRRRPPRAPPADLLWAL